MENHWTQTRITVEDSRIDDALLALEIQRRQTLDLKKQIRHLWIALLSTTTGCLIHLLNHLIFM